MTTDEALDTSPGPQEEDGRETPVTPRAPGFMRLRLAFLSVVVLLSVGCDQLTKSAAIENLRGAPPRSFLGGSFRLLYAENPGAFLGLGGGLPESWRFALLVLGAALVVLVAGFFLIRRADAPLPLVTAGALIVAGGIGNLIDRVWNDGRVVDFAHMKLGPLETGVFNVADVQLMVGAGVLILWSLKSTPKDRPGGGSEASASTG